MQKKLNNIENISLTKGQWQSIFDVIRDPVILHDCEDRVLHANSAYISLSKYSFEDTIGKPYWQSFPHINHPIFDSKKRFTESLTHSLAIPFLDFQGREFISFSHCIQGNTSRNNMIVHVLQDVSEQQDSYRQLDKYSVQLHAALEGTVHAVAKAIEMRDPYTAGHQRRVGEIGRAIAQKLQLEHAQCEGVYYGGIVHDIGKISIPSEILTWPGRLSEQQYALVKEHPVIGSHILEEIKFPWPIMDIVLQHHERLDGSGYPYGLSGDDIILEARIIAVADVVEAMSIQRPYRKGLGIEEGLNEITRKRGLLFDANVVDACLELFHKDGYQIHC